MYYKNICLTSPQEEHYLPSRLEACRPCDCSTEGSDGGECDQNGQCSCRPGVAGLQCQTCQQNHWNFPACRPCKCLPEGTLGNSGACGDSSGECQCKQFVTGENCDQCTEGYFQVISTLYHRSACDILIRLTQTISSVALPASATATPQSATWLPAMSKVSNVLKTC